MGMEKAVEQLGPLAVAFVFVGIVIAFGAVILGGMAELDAVYDSVEANGTASPTTPLPTNITGLTTGDAGLDTTTVYYDADSNGNLTTLVQGTDYNVYEDAGTLEILDSSTLSGYDETTDEIEYDYTYLQEGTASNVITAAQDALGTFGSFLGVIAIVALAAIIFVLLKVFGGMSSTGKSYM